MCPALIDPGDAVVVEAPSYLGALMAFAAAEARDRAGRDGRGRPARRPARGAARGRAAPEVRLHDPRVPEPDRPHAAGRAAPRAGRPLPPPRRAHLRGRRLPRARVGRRAAADPVVAGAGRRAPGGHVLEELLPRRAAGLGGRPGRRRGRADRREGQHGPVRGRARPAAARGVRPRRRVRAPPAGRAGALRIALGRALGRARARAARRRRLDGALRRLPDLADAARGAGLHGTARGRPRGRRGLRPGRPVLRRGGRGPHAAALLQPPRRARARGRRRAPRRRASAPRSTAFHSTRPAGRCGEITHRWRPPDRPTGGIPDAQQDHGHHARPRRRPRPAGDGERTGGRSLEGLRPHAQQGEVHRPDAHADAGPARVERVRAGASSSRR